MASSSSSVSFLFPYDVLQSGGAFTVSSGGGGGGEFFFEIAASIVLPVWRLNDYEMSVVEPSVARGIVDI